MVTGERTIRLAIAALAVQVLWSPPGRCEGTDRSANALMQACRSAIHEGPPPYTTKNTQAAYDNGWCHGFINAIAVVDPSICRPPGVTIDQTLRVVVKYIDERPQRMHEDFAILVQEALATTWPCTR